MEFSSFFFHLLFFSQIFQLSNTIVSSAKVKIPAEDAHTDNLDSLTEQIPSFDSFARTFNKSYPTDLDRMAHMKYYLVRALKTFRSIMRYKKHESTSYMKINEMSDWSPAQVKQLFMSSDTYEKVKPAAIELADIDNDDVGDEEVEDEDEDEKYADIEKRLVQHRIKRDADDVVWIDHRRSNCLDVPRIQGSCRAAYAFAAIAFYEWLNCMKTTKFQAFSEQYIIDCGHRHENFGCSGGNPAKAMEFVENCGLLLLQDYPYIGIQQYCPYPESAAYENMGALRIDEPSMAFIPLDRLVEHLEFGPIILIIEINPEFVSYLGGVDDNVGHTPELLHSMLLIGHGREDGKDYWLFRNSLLTVGGDGLYKLNKNVDCLRGGAGIGVNRPMLG